MAFSALNGILGCERQVGKSEWGTLAKCLGVTVKFRCLPHLSFPARRFEKLMNEIKWLVCLKAVFVAQMHKLARKPNFAQTAAMGRIGRVVLRRIHDLVYMTFSRMGLVLVVAVALRYGPQDHQLYGGNG